MLDFTYYSPTRVEFGKQSIFKLGALLKKLNVKNVLIHYGCGSIKKSGILQKAVDEINAVKIKYELLGGVVPNPQVSLVRKGIKLCKEKNIDFILAVGGGSVIDSAKAIGMGIKIEHDIWDVFLNKQAISGSLPIGTILTLAAAGSELSCRCVISNEADGKKLGVSCDEIRPVFSILNPEFTFSVSKYQTACGIVDIMMHTFERYFTTTPNVAFTDSLCESLLKNVINAGTIAYKEPNNYEARATLMWAGSLSHNDLMGLGRLGDWACHKLEHELSALYPSISHGAGLAVLFPHWCRYVMNVDINRFSRFAKEVFGVHSDGLSTLEHVQKGIEACTCYFNSLDMPKTLREFGVKKEDLAFMAKNCADFYGTIGFFKALNYDDMLNIYNLAF